ncbi:hypothetical protein MMC34_001048 [Xylographa carneopallida]|nr:hypothetical protein [Xylographa carneopallida]
MDDSMQELDPSPIEDSPLIIEKDSYFPLHSPSSPAPPARSSSLGLSGHSLTWWLLRTQRYSSYAFTAFLTAHITNVSLIPLLTRSLPAADTYLLLTRPYYQSPLAEPLLVVAPLALHILSGATLRLHRRRQTALRYGAESRADRRTLAWPKLSGTSALGYVLAPLVLGHACVNRVLPLWVEGGSSSVGLQYVAHGFAKDPWVAGVGYAVLVAVGSWHVVWGWGKWLGWTPEEVGWEVEERERGKRRRWWVLNGVAALVAGVWMAGGLGVVGRGGEMSGWLGRQYDGLYRRIPILGRRY